MVRNDVATDEDMSNQNRSPSSEDSLVQLPVFELSYAPDDKDDPSYVTIFADTKPEITTHWITIDADYAVPLDEIA